MPEPGYNDGDAPPFWLWLAAAAVVFVLLLTLRSCS